MIMNYLHNYFMEVCINSNIDSETVFQLGGKLSNVHMISKNKIENKEFF